jgi:3-hydroxymyristoyl/3-hydroxydecanoyl-(acyl carrier protein) dehydratase
MPLDPAFVEDAIYLPGGLLIDEILEIDRDAGRVVCRMPTHDDLPITREQRAHPVKHPRHVSGGLLIHMTGVVGLVHAYYVLDLRHAEGWVGYGGRIHSGKFKHLAQPGDPLILEGEVTRLRRGSERIVARYDLRFRQGERTVYEGDQTAMWMKVQEA